MQLKSILKEPLLHFLAIGAALFIFFQWSGGGSGPSSNRIVVTSGQIGRLASSFTKLWMRPPSEAELKSLIDEWLREELAVREAMAAGLDRDDTVIRRRLRQKLEFVFEDSVETAPPGEPQLQAWLARHADDFRIEPRVALRQVSFSRDRRGAAAERDARAALARLKQAGAEAPIDKFGDATLLPQEVELVPRGDIDRIFGKGFTERIDKLETGAWSGPVESSFGLHLVMIRKRIEGSVPELASIRPAVEREYAAEQRRGQIAAMYERLLGKYTVVVEGAGNVKGAAGSRP